MPGPLGLTWSRSLGASTRPKPRHTQGAERKAEEAEHSRFGDGHRHCAAAGRRVTWRG